MRALGALALGAFAAAAPPSALNVLPLPTSLSSTPGCLTLPASFAITPAGAGARDAFLLAAIARAARVVATASARGEALGACAAPAAPLDALTVVVTAPRAAPLPALGDDESYELALAAGGASALRARTVWGALRGLETFAQLVASASVGGAAFVPAASVIVADAPRFAHRGLLVDTGRAFLPVSILNATIDAMAAVKLNVLHWHVSDDEAFPLDSAVAPRLVLGAQQAPARSHVYSAADARALVARAAERGIRVVPELDVPGHTTSWFAGYPALRTACELPPGAEFAKPMDPTLDATYAFLGALLGEVAGVFPDALLHVGGDEVEMSCWRNSSAVAAFMAARGIAPGDFAALQLYFGERVAALLPPGRRAVVWEANSGAASRYPAGAVVQVWKERHGDSGVLEGLLRAGYDVVWTTPDWCAGRRAPRARAGKKAAAAAPRLTPPAPLPTPQTSTTRRPTRPFTRAALTAT